MRQLTANDLLFIVAAARWTVLLALTTFVAGGLLGAVLVLGRIAQTRILRRLTGAYVYVIQGTPLLIQLFIWYFGLSLIGGNLPAFVAAAIGLTLYSSVFFAEIWRGAIESIPKAQWEASASLGLTRLQQLTRIILPQALRPATPPTVGFMVQIVKNTSLTALVGFIELTRAGQMINNATFEPLRIFGLIATLYFVLCYPLSWLSRRLERRLYSPRSAFQHA